jgi:hypothetical protein
MDFNEQIGRALFVYLLFPIALYEDKPPLDGLDGKLLGVEASGIWIESKAWGARFENTLWELEMKTAGEEAVGTTSLCCFVPFSQIRMVVGSRLRTD